LKKNISQEKEENVKMKVKKKKILKKLKSIQSKVNKRKRS